jgi:hypothetical protein
MFREEMHVSSPQPTTAVAAAAVSCEESTHPPTHMRFQNHPKQNGAKKTKKKQNREKIARERASGPEICLKTRPQEELGRWW